MATTSDDLFRRQEQLNDIGALLSSERDSDSLQLSFGGSCHRPTPEQFPDLHLFREDGLPNDTMVAVYAAITGKTGNIADAYSLVGFDFSGMRQFDARTGSLADFKLTDKDHYELRIAALLHDCGKVTTPVHIVEKPPSRKPSTTAFI